MALFDISLQRDKPTSVEGIARKLTLYGSRQIPEPLKAALPKLFTRSRCLLIWQGCSLPASDDLAIRTHERLTEHSLANWQLTDPAFRQTHQPQSWELAVGSSPAETDQAARCSIRMPSVDLEKKEVRHTSSGTRLICLNGSKQRKPIENRKLDHTHLE